MKTIKGLVKELCKYEGKKVGVNIAQMSEVVGAMSDILYQDSCDKEIYSMLVRNGEKRATPKTQTHCLVCDKKSKIVVCNKCAKKK